MTFSTQFIVARDDLAKCRLIETPLPSAVELPEDGLLVSVDRFAFTANNITYALLGDQLKYWSLFPAPEGFGNIPVWGFGRVIETCCPNIAKGEVIFGYLPMATHLVMTAADVKRTGFRDSSSHRQDVSPVYNAYSRVTGLPDFEGRNGSYQALLRPLFMLSFLVDDFLASERFFGAERVILSSASSKTAFGLAWLLHTGRDHITTLGLTSRRNMAFVTSLGCYDDVVTYDDIESIRADEPVAFVDMAGDASLRARLHRHFGDMLVYSGRIGLTHQDMAAGDEKLPGARPAWFFAPDQIRRRSKDWGPGGIDQRFAAVWPGFTGDIGARLDIVENRGPNAVQHIYLDTLKGVIRPEQAYMLSLAP